MKAPILNKDFIGTRTGNDHTCQVNSRHIAFKTSSIAARTSVRPFKANTERFKEGKVRMIAGHRKNKIVCHTHPALRRLKQDRVRQNLNNLRIEVRRDLAGLDAVLDVRLDPV